MDLAPMGPRSAQVRFILKKRAANSWFDYPVRIVILTKKKCLWQELNGVCKHRVSAVTAKRLWPFDLGQIHCSAKRH